MNSLEVLHFKVTITDKDMFYFIINHVYSKTTSYLTLAFSVVCLILFPFSLGWNDIFLSGILLFGGLLYTVFAQILIWFQSKRQVRVNPVFKQAIHYTIDHQRFQVTQGEHTAEFDWQNLSQVLEKKRSFLFYISKNQAFILPKSQMEETDISKTKEILKSVSQQGQVKIKLRNQASEEKTA